MRIKISLKILKDLPIAHSFKKRSLAQLFFWEILQKLLQNSHFAENL